jgi:hypothetical protein
MTINDAIAAYVNAREIFEESEKEFADVRKLFEMAKENLLQTFNENGTKSVKHDEFGTVSAEIKTKYGIAGGADQTLQRFRVMQAIREWTTFGDEIKTFENMHETKLQSAIDSLPFDVRQRLIGEGALTVFAQPKIIYRSKK